MRKSARTDLVRLSKLLLLLLSAAPLLSGQGTPTVTFQIVTPTGQTIVSLFDGLRPSWFAQSAFLMRWSPGAKRKRPWRGELKYSLLPKGLAARYVEADCSTCPDPEPCTGHYTVLVPLPPGMGCDTTGCPTVNNFTNDPTQPGLCAQGEENSFCGAACCTDAAICSNNNGC